MRFRREVLPTAIICSLVLVPIMALAQVPPQNLPPPGAYQQIPNFSGPGAGLLFRTAINDRFSGVQPISPRLVNLSFSNLPAEQDGLLIYCVDCQSTIPCDGGGAGAWAFGQNGQWTCTAPNAPAAPLYSGSTVAGDLSGTLPSPTVSAVLGGKAPLYSGETAPALNGLAGAKLDGSDTLSSLNGAMQGVLNVRDFGATASQTTITCTATAASADLGCTSIGDFTANPNQGILVPHAGAAFALSSPSAPTVAPASMVLAEAATIPASSAYTVTVAHAAGFVKVAAVKFNNDSTYGYLPLENVGTMTPGPAEYTVNSGGVLTFNSADAGKNIYVYYFYNDTTGATTHTYQVAALDAAGGESAASTTTTITDSNAALGFQHYNRVTWTPVSGATGYAIYRDGTLIWRQDPIPTWQAHYPVQVGEIIDGGNGHQYVCVQPGVTGITAPTFPTGAGATVTDASSSNQGPTSAIWQEDGAVVDEYDDYGAVASGDYAAPNSGYTADEPNIADTPPASALADALVTTISAINGTTVTMATAATSGASSVAVHHDDAAAIQAALDASVARDRAVRVFFPDGWYNIAKPLVVPNAQNTIALFAKTARLNNQANQPYGSPKYMAYDQTGSGAYHAGGAVIHAILPVDGIDFSGVSSAISNGPHIDGLSFVGYGVGPSVGINLPGRTGGTASMLGQFADLKARVFNFHTGWLLNMQWSELNQPQAIGCYDGIVFGATAPAGVSGNNANTIIYPTVQYVQHYGLMLRDGSNFRVVGGNGEGANASVAVVDANATVSNFENEDFEVSPQYLPAAVQVFAADAPVFDGGRYTGWGDDFGDALNSQALRPGIVFYQSRAGEMVNGGDMRDVVMGLSGLAVGPTRAMVAGNSFVSSSANVFFSSKCTQCVESSDSNPGRLINESTSSIMNFGPDSNGYVHNTTGLNLDDALTNGFPVDVAGGTIGFNAVGGTLDLRGVQYLTGKSSSSLVIRSGDFYPAMTVSSGGVTTFNHNATMSGSTVLAAGSTTVASLPACDATHNKFGVVWVTDANAACSYGTAPAGGGTNLCLVGCDGTSWKEH